MRRAWVTTVAAIVTAAALAGCSASSGGTPDFQPSPTGNDVEGQHGVHVSPIQPVPSFGGGNGGGGGGQTTPNTNPSASPSTSAPKRKKIDPLVVATHLTTPVGLTFLPDGSALVGERTTGRIVRVQPKPGRPVPTVRTLHGLDPAGGGGLLDLAVSPDYAEDNLIYAYVTTANDNRVVDFTLTGPVTPVLTGIPRGTSGNAGRMAFGADGSLYVGTGDAGRPSLAGKQRSLAGKVLRVNDIGRPARGNPTPSSPVFTTGMREVAGLCPSPAGVLETQTAASGRPEVNVLRKGLNYGYPRPSGSTGTPVTTLPAKAAGPGGCAVADGRLWVASLDAQALFSAPPTTGTSQDFGTFTAVLAKRYGRLRTVVGAPDGALWLTTANRGGNGRPVAADERVIRYVPQSSDGPGSTT